MPKITATLAATGSDTLPGGIAALLLLALGGGTLLVRRRTTAVRGDR